MNPQPHLEYTFYADTIEEFYTDLNSSIFDYNPYLRYDSLVAHYDTAFSYDSLLYYSAELCNYWINGFSCNLRIYDVESDSYNYLFGEGLGIVTATIVNGDPYGNPSVNNKLTYFEKGSNTCGVYDALTSIIKNELLNGLSLFPHPVKECLHVGFTNNVNEKIFIEVYDIQNKLLNRSLVEKGIALIDFRMFSSGIYLLKIVSNSGVVVKKVMKD